MLNGNLENNLDLFIPLEQMTVENSLTNEVTRSLMNNIEVILALISVLEMLTICQAGRIAIYMVKWTVDVILTTSESLLR